MPSYSNRHNNRYRYQHNPWAQYGRHSRHRLMQSPYSRYNQWYPYFSYYPYGTGSNLRSGSKRYNPQYEDLYFYNYPYVYGYY